MPESMYGRLSRSIATIVRRRQDHALVVHARLERLVVALELQALDAYRALGALGQRHP